MPTVDIEVVADLEEIKLHSPEWHQARKLGIGGSDAGAICGVNKWKTPYQVWVDKISVGFEDPGEEAEPIIWGKLLEGPVRKEFSRRSGIEVLPFPKMVRNTDHPFMLANVDGLTGTAEEITGVYEGKTSRFEWLQDGEVEVPLEYAVQGQHYLAVLGLDVVHYACLVGGQRLRVAQVERNDSLIDDLIAIEEAFWDKYCVTGYAPPAEAADRPVLSKLWVAEAGKTVELTGTEATALQVRADYVSKMATLKESVEKIDAELMAFMGDAEVALWKGDVAITWKQDQKGRLNGKALEAAHPEIAAEFRGEPGRRFITKEIPS